LSTYETARHKLPRGFYVRDTDTVARELLGKYLVRVAGGRERIGKIVEVEAYLGPHDLASHSSRGRTARTEVMFGPPGHAYVYLIYGMYHCFNIVTEREGFPAAVLVRALEPLEGLDLMRKRRRPVGARSVTELTSGPGRLCQALAIDRGHDGLDLCREDSPLFLEGGDPVANADIGVSARVNVRGDRDAVDARWRFYLKHNPHVSH